VASPMLVIVSGPAGSGKTTLAHEVARALGCPAICRDEIKEGMAHATPGFTPGPDDPLTRRTLSTFFDVLELLLRAGVTVVAEAAFQDRLWRPGLEPLTRLASLRVIRCGVDQSIARDRIAHRVAVNPRRAAHEDHRLLRELEAGASGFEAFDPITLDAPTIFVDTSDGYHPGLADIVAFVDGVAGG